MQNLDAAHGGELVNLIVDGERADVLKDMSRDLESVTLSDCAVCDLELLMNGGFSPLTGFMNQTDYASVLDRMRLNDGTLWPMPICLDISEGEAKSFEVGKSVAIRDGEGFMLAVMRIESIWPIDKKHEAEILFGTTDERHPGVDQLFHKKGAYYAGGTIEGLQLPLHSAFKRYRHTPLELRALFKKLGWRRIVGFHTRNPLHRAQLEMTLRAMGEAKAGLLLHPVAEQVRQGEIDYFTRVHCYLDVAG
ncbi:MAG: adenylyltransferase, partial [Deltaproteobacteria bacterium]|nr:adenylyltransferase [Deltaproteobacteria bacterium]